MNMMFLPMVSSWRRWPERKPSPNPTNSSSEPTPQAMPNMVRNERNLCAHRVRRVWPKISSSSRIWKDTRWRAERFRWIGRAAGRLVTGTLPRWRYLPILKLDVQCARVAQANGCMPLLRVVLSNLKPYPILAFAFGFLKLGINSKPIEGSDWLACDFGIFCLWHCSLPRGILARHFRDSSTVRTAPL